MKIVFLIILIFRIAMGVYAEETTTAVYGGMSLDFGMEVAFSLNCYALYYPISFIGVGLKGGVHLAGLYGGALLQVIPIKIKTDVITCGIFGDLFLGYAPQTTGTPFFLTPRIYVGFGPPGLDVPTYIFLGLGWPQSIKYNDQTGYFLEPRSFYEGASFVVSFGVLTFPP